VQLQIDKRYSSHKESLHLKLTLELGDGSVNCQSWQWKRSGDQHLRHAPCKVKVPPSERWPCQTCESFLTRETRHWTLPQHWGMSWSLNRSSLGGHSRSPGPGAHPTQDHNRAESAPRQQLWVLGVRLPPTATAATAAIWYWVAILAAWALWCASVPRGAAMSLGGSAMAITTPTAGAGAAPPAALPPPLGR
jgi:hypothetical protein